MGKAAFMHQGVAEVYIEGLLVQSREPEDVMKWAFAGIMVDSTQSLFCEFVNSYTKHRDQEDHRSKPWAHHFKDFDAYVIMKPRIDKPNCSEITVNFNNLNADIPNLMVVCRLNTPLVGADFIAALVSLGRFYVLDTILLEEGNNGEKNQEESKEGQEESQIGSQREDPVDSQD